MLGGLRELCANHGQAYPRWAVYAGRILKAKNRPKLPVLCKRRRFELVINLKTCEKGRSASYSAIVRARPTR